MTRIATDNAWLEALDALGEQFKTMQADHINVVAAASDYARLTMVENFPTTDIAVHRAYETLRDAIEKANIHASKA